MPKIKIGTTYKGTTYKVKIGKVTINDLQMTNQDYLMMIERKKKTKDVICLHHFLKVLFLPVDKNMEKDCSECQRKLMEAL